MLTFLHGIAHIYKETEICILHFPIHVAHVYLLISAGKCGSQVVTLLLIPAHGHNCQHISASCNQKQNVLRFEQSEINTKINAILIVKTKDDQKQKIHTFLLSAAHLMWLKNYDIWVTSPLMICVMIICCTSVLPTCWPADFICAQMTLK